ncbi:TPA: hypothetical protein DIC38_01615 [Candidatus Nomurabacteria bacterium]|nr:MAG: hypothetical protein O210_OD1C00001G0408 [Parcubacteria bacterium RAAC4_OD1_1]HCY26359.1 hypothetical protein [Candidatus Nomurabacteria bacterium]
MEEIEIQKNNKENLINVEKEPTSISLSDSNQLESEIKDISNKINTNEETIITTTQRVGDIRSELGLTGEIIIPSVDFNKNKIIRLENKKQELETRLSEILKSDVSGDYKDIIEKTKQSKIDWANSPELERRLRLKGATEEDILNIKEWLINNTNNVKTVILPREKYEELKSVISEMTNETEVLDGAGFYSPGGRDDLPEEAKNSVFMKENIVPPLRVQDGMISERKYIDEKTLSHELGHAAQDGLLQAEEFSGTWNPKFKDGAPDREYVGQIQETDTRIRSMFNSLGFSFDPEKEVFGRKHLEILREKQKNGLLDKDTKDLLDHYDDIELVKLANRMPAI